MQECDSCGKELKEGKKAIAITGGIMDYKNCEGFRANEDAYIAIYCPKCYDQKKRL
jgi:predicted nucleic-acid-binding Zn-ribbon protein